MSDYGSDRYGHVEASWRTRPPPREYVARALRTTCPDCRVNVYIEEHPDTDGEYVLKVAHDETCPWLAEHEAASGA